MPVAPPAWYCKNHIPGLAYQYVVIVFALAYLVFFGCLLTLLGGLFSPFSQIQRLQRWARQLLQWLLKIFFTILKFSGLLCLDASAIDALQGQKNLVIIANHPCLMDALFFSSRLPNVVAVMKSAILKNPVFYGAAILAGFIRSDSPRKFMETCKDTIESEAQLLFFPEGTRTKTREVNVFKGGFALLAKESGVSVQTVFIGANTDFLSKGWPLWRKPKFPLKYQLSLGERFEIDHSADHKQFSRKMEAYFKDKIPDYQLPVVPDLNQQIQTYAQGK